MKNAFDKLLSTFTHIIQKMFSINYMVKTENVKDTLPKTKEAYKSFAGIAIPSVIEMVFMSLIGSVDMIMLRGLDSPSVAIAAVGLAGQPRMITLSIFFALNVGVTAIVARRKGRNLPDEANEALRTAIIMLLALSFVVMTCTLIWMRPLLVLAGAQADTIDMSHDYFRILTYFLPINALTMCINAAQRGVGNTRVTLLVNLVSNLVNVLFNYLLIYGNWGFPKLGVEGAAWATGIGFCVGFILCMISIISKRFGDNFLSLSFRDNWRIHKEAFVNITRVGGNAMVEQIVVRIGFFVYAAIVASLGTAAFAAHQVAMQFLSISFTFGDGLGVAGTSLVGQMLGRERPDLATIYGKCGQRLSVIISLLLAGSIVMFRYQLVGIFLDTSIPVNVLPFEIAVNLLFIVAVFQPFQMSTVVISGCLRGAGDNIHVAIVMMLCVVLVRPLVSLFAIHVLGFGIFGAWTAALIDMMIRLILMYRRFNSGKWQLKKV